MALRLLRAFVFSLRAFVVAFDAAAQGKKVYISVDMEGISGVVGDDQTSAGQPEYNRSRKLMAEDANAAIRGAFEGGATEVVVNDSHGSQRNLLPGGSRSPRPADQPQLQASRHGRGTRRDLRRGDLRRLSRQGRLASRTVRAHRLRRREGRAGQRPIGRRRRAQHADGALVRRAGGDDYRRRCGGRAAEGMDAERSRRRGEARDQHARRRRQRRRPRRAARSRRPRRTASPPRKKPARDRQAAYKVRMQLRNFTIPEVATAFSEIQLVAPDTVEFSRATHAGGLPHHPRALPLHQSRLTIDPNWRQVPSLPFTRSTIVHPCHRAAAGRSFRLLPCPAFPTSTPAHRRRGAHRAAGTSRSCRTTSRDNARRRRRGNTHAPRTCDFGISFRNVRRRN